MKAEPIFLLIFKIISTLAIFCLRKEIGTRYNSNTSLGNITYDCNIRGWMLGANGAQLYYLNLSLTTKSLLPATYL